MSCSCACSFTCRTSDYVNIVLTQRLDELGTAGTGDPGVELISNLWNGFMAGNLAFTEGKEQ